MHLHIRLQYIEYALLGEFCHAMVDDFQSLELPIVSFLQQNTADGAPEKCLNVPLN